MIAAVLALFLQAHPITLQPSTIGAPDVVLPSATLGTPYYTVKVLPGAAATTVRAAGSELVDGAATVSVSAGGAVTFRAVNGAWYIVSAYSTAAPGGGTPASSVVTETAFGQASAVGVATNYAREDHTHGTPAAPAGGTPATTVVAETALGAASAVGVDADYAREDHTHGSASEATIEAAVDLQDLQGAVTDGQVPDGITVTLAGTATALAANGANCGVATEFAVGVNASGVAECEAIADADVPDGITISLAAAATALAANPANCADATHFSTGITAAGVADCEAIADADVPNTITVDLATLATTATTANAGDSATAFFPAGTIEIARGGTGQATAVAAFDALAPTNSTGDMIYHDGSDNVRLARGSASQQLRMNGAGTIPEWFTPSSGAANAVTTSIAVTSDGMYFSASVAAAWALATTAINCQPYGGGASTPTAESIAVSGVEGIVANISAGVGFTLMVRNPYGLEGTVEFRCVGV